MRIRTYVTTLAAGLMACCALLACGKAECDRLSESCGKCAGQVLTQCQAIVASRIEQACIDAQPGIDLLCGTGGGKTTTTTTTSGTGTGTATTTTTTTTTTSGTGTTTTSGSTTASQ